MLERARRYSPIDDGVTPGDATGVTSDRTPPKGAAFHGTPKAHAHAELAGVVGLLGVLTLLAETLADNDNADPRKGS